jgi:hypothetical protein
VSGTAMHMACTLLKVPPIKTQGKCCWAATAQGDAVYGPPSAALPPAAGGPLGCGGPLAAPAGGAFLASSCSLREDSSMADMSLGRALNSCSKAVRLSGAGCLGGPLPSGCGGWVDDIPQAAFG